MKNLKIFAIVSVLAVLVSCNNGLTKQTDKEEGLVAFSLEFDGKAISSNNTRNIGIDSVEDALKDFVFAVNLINKEDSSKNQNMSGKISAVSLFLQYLTLAKGSWTVKIDGSHPDKDSHISGSTDFTVGGHEAFFILKLQPSGSAKGCIEYNTRLGKVEENQKAILYPLEKYLSGTIEDGDGIVYEYPDEANPPANAYKLYANLNPDVIVLEDVTPGNYFLQIKSDNQIKCGDVAYVYPGLTSKGVMNEGKSNLFLDYGYVYQDILGSQETINVIEFENGIAKLPGYGSSEDGEREPVRPGYIFTGWYDSKEAANIGLWPSVPLESKFVSQETYAGSNIYTIADRTLYAGWKKAAIPEELMNKNLFLKKDTGDGIYIIKGNFNNKFKYSGYSVSDIPQSYVVAGDLIYWVGPQLTFVDIGSLEKNETEGSIYNQPQNHIALPIFEGYLEDSNSAQALYYDGENTLYVLCVSYNVHDEGIWNLVKVSLPENAGETAVANIFAIENQDNFENSPLYDYNVDPGDFREITICNFVVKEEKMYVLYRFRDSAGREGTQLASFNIDVSTSSFSADGVVKDFAGIYQPTKFGVGTGLHAGEDLLSNVKVQDMYVDNTGIYLLIRDNAITWVNSGDYDTLVSTGALVVLDFDFNVKKTYGKAEAKDFPYNVSEYVPVLSVDHEYDISCFAEPYKLLAVYDRKFIFQERGIFLYLNEDKRYIIKNFLNRVTVFDLDKECITYTQVTDTDIGENASCISVSSFGFSFENNN